MTYTYAYRTSDGERREATIEAADRAEVFAVLRGRGIRPIKVVAADGSKANGEVRGVRKRVVAAGAAALVICAVAASVIAFRVGDAQGVRHGAEGTDFLTDTTRRQVIGDAAVIEKGIRTGWADVFADEGERFLASFAVPGVKAGVGSTRIEALEAALANRSGGGPRPEGLGIEARQIRAMVEGMKQEARAYLAAGGTVLGYGKRLTERQDAEISLYRRAEGEILAAQKVLSEREFNLLYERRNDQLRNLGIRLIALED